jgi:hypothetical protein
MYCERTLKMIFPPEGGKNKSIFIMKNAHGESLFFMNKEIPDLI